jgi:nucleotide-binding universal stress UspA family protein
MANEKTNRARRIVTGVDGSEASRAALRWALHQAELTGAEVEAAMAWQWPNTYDWPIPVDTDFRAWARQVLDETVAAVTKSVGSEITVHRTLIQGDAAAVLLDAGRGAELLVIGSRGHGGFAGALLGLALMAEGSSNSGIARALWVTEGTVEKHVQHILTKLRLPDSGDDHRRVLAVVTFLEAR